jgi:hypothetical protein
MMLPREHGAYGQLLLPMATALAIGRPSLAAGAVATAVVAAFISHEPLTVLLGRRGAALRRSKRREARVWFAASLAAALSAGALAVVLMPPDTQWALLVPIMPAARAAVSVVRGRERTTAGEVVSAGALASASFPVAVAASASAAVALACVLAFTSGFVAATVSVRAVVAQVHGGGAASRYGAAATAVSLVGSVAVLAFGGVVSTAALWGALPVCAVALALVVAVPPPCYLRQIAWTLVGASVLTGIILVSAAP